MNTNRNNMNINRNKCLKKRSVQYCVQYMFIVK